MEIAIATDAAYLPWCATTLLSCVEAQRDPSSIHFHFLAGQGVGQHELKALRSMLAASGATLTVHPIDERLLQHLPAKPANQGGRIVWVRTVLPELLPDVDRVVYLDADVLAVEDLAALWSEDLRGAPLAAVANVVDPAMYGHVESLGIVDPKRYFNAGVLLIDLNAWREEGATEALARAATREQPLPWYDQDALNMVFADRWLPLHPRWNAMNSLWTWSAWANDVHGASRVAEATRAPALLHFEGPMFSKPWHFLSPHPWRQAYRSTLARTPWAGTALEDRTLATRAMRAPAERLQDPSVPSAVRCTIGGASMTSHHPSPNHHEAVADRRDGVAT